MDYIAKKSGTRKKKNKSERILIPKREKET